MRQRFTLLAQLLDANIGRCKKAAVVLALSLFAIMGATAGAPARFQLLGHFGNVVSNDQG